MHQHIVYNHDITTEKTCKTVLQNLLSFASYEVKIFISGSVSAEFDRPIRILSDPVERRQKQKK